MNVCSEPSVLSIFAHFVHVCMVGVREHGCSEERTFGSMFACAACLLTFKVYTCQRFMFRDEHENICSLRMCYLHVREHLRAAVKTCWQKKFSECLSRNSVASNTINSELEPPSSHIGIFHVGLMFVYFQGIVLCAPMYASVALAE